MSAVIEIAWKVHTPNLLKEILNNNHVGILSQPLNIFAGLLQGVATRAIELDDPRLNELMCLLTLYEQADPTSKSYDPVMLKLVSKRALEASVKRYGFNGLAGCVIQKKNRRTGFLVGLYHSAQAGLDTDSGPWTTVCEEHHTCVGHRTLSHAHDHLAAPWGWCEECTPLLEDRS